MTMEAAQQSVAKRPAKCRKTRSSLVRRLVSAKDDPAKQRIRRWLSDINDERLLGFGLTAEDICPPACLARLWQRRQAADVRFLGSVRTFTTRFMVLEDRP
jgi:hypothetical protein